jgi:hypothetical protein
VQILPIAPGVTEQRFATALGDGDFVFRVLWNHRDESWYLDAYEEDGVTAIFHGAKIVLGAHIARVHRHPLLVRGAFIAVDTSHARTDAGFFDLGTRVLVLYVTEVELVAMRFGLTGS